MAKQFIRASVVDTELEHDAMRGSEHFLTQEVRHPDTGEKQPRAEVVNYEQQRRDAMQDALQNKKEYVPPTMVRESTTVDKSTYPAITATTPDNPSNEQPTPPVGTMADNSERSPESS